MGIKNIELKYGCNPNQVPSRVEMGGGGELPFEIINGRAGYINLLDALNSWQLVKELKEATGKASAASFKHVSPAGAAIGESIKGAYERARGADRVSSYGDFAALSDECDEETAEFLLKEVSDGIIAPSYTDEALKILKQKRKGNYLVISIDKEYEAPERERKEVYGVSFEQKRNDIKFDERIFENIPTLNKEIPESARRDLIISMITLKYTQSNSVCYVKEGQAIGIGAGQQARILCTRLAGSKADIWYLRQHEKVKNLPFKEGMKHPERDNAIDVYLSEDAEQVTSEGEWRKYFTSKPEEFSREEKAEWLKTLKDVSLGSDAFFPFGDNIERAHKSGVRYIAQAGGSVRDDNVIDACDKYGIAMAMTGIRLFHH